MGDWWKISSIKMYELVSNTDLATIEFDDWWCNNLVIVNCSENAAGKFQDMTLPGGAFGYRDKLTFIDW